MQETDSPIEADPGGLRSHPRLLVSSAGLAGLRARAGDARINRFGFSTKEVWDGIRANADRLVQASVYSYSVKIPDRKGGVLEHWQYTLSDETPPGHPKSPMHPPWTAMFQERPDSIITRLVHFSFAYLVTGQQLYFEKAREIALHLTHWHYWTDPDWSPDSKLLCCLDTGHCTYGMGMFYDWCFDRLTEAERVRVRDAVISKGILPSLSGVDHYPADTNGYAVITGGAGLAAIAVLPEEPRAGEWLAACIAKTRVSLDRGPKDGGTFEGPGYGTYLLDSFALFLDGLVSAGIENDLLDHRYLAAMPRYCIGLLAPDTGQIPCFSDGSPDRAVPQLMSILAQRGSTDASWYIEQIDAIKPIGIYDFIRFDDRKIHPERPTWTPSTVFHDIGYASLRDGFNADAPSLFFKAGPIMNNIGHNHFDHNSFVISYGGQWIIPDRGYVSRHTPTERKFSLGSVGHCTVVLDATDAYFADTTVPCAGHDQVERYGGRILDFFGSRFLDYVKGEAADAYNTDEQQVLEKFERSIVYLKPHMFIISDKLAAPRPHAYSFLLHSDKSGAIEREGDVVLVRRGGAEVYVRVMSSLPTESHVGLYPGAESYGPFLRVETEAALAAGFLTILYPRPFTADARGPTPQIIPSGTDGLDVKIGEERFLVSFGAKGRPRQMADLATDAELAVVGFDAQERPRHAFLQAGRYVSLRGQDLLRYDKETTADAELPDSREQPGTSNR